MVRPHGRCRTRALLRTTIVAGALAAVLLLACRQAPRTDDAARSSRLPAMETQVAATLSDSLDLSLEAPEQVPAGAAIPLTIRVVNIGERTIDLYLRGRDIAFDLVVTNVDGAVVWRRLRDEVVQAILRIDTLPPGDTLELFATWDQRTNDGESVAPGNYTARGEVLTEGDPLVTPGARFRIGSD